MKESSNQLSSILSQARPEPQNVQTAGLERSCSRWCCAAAGVYHAAGVDQSTASAPPALAFRPPPCSSYEPLPQCECAGADRLAITSQIPVGPAHGAHCHLSGVALVPLALLLHRSPRAARQRPPWTGHG